MSCAAEHLHATLSRERAVLTCATASRQHLQFVHWRSVTTQSTQSLTSLPTSQTFNEVMPTVYSRFTEKEAREWRQIYKALVLLECARSLSGKAY